MPEPLLSCASCGTAFPRRELRCPQCQAVGVSHLYKYCRFDLHALPHLIDRTLWFAAVDSLNDPFEFAFALREMHVNGVPIDRESLNTARSAMKQYGVLSLSEVNNDILMWSHYSASHTGFCMQFERTDANDLGSYGRCFPVIYDDEYPTFLPHELEDAKNVARVMTVKARRWAYELEWRMLAHAGQRAYPYPGALTGILFGCRMPLPFRKAVAAILRDAVTYSEAVVSQTAYTVEIQPVSAESLY